MDDYYGRNRSEFKTISISIEKLASIIHYHLDRWGSVNHYNGDITIDGHRVSVFVDGVICDIMDYPRDEELRQERLKNRLSFRKELLHNLQISKAEYEAAKEKRCDETIEEAKAKYMNILKAYLEFNNETEKKYRIMKYDHSEVNPYNFDEKLDRIYQIIKEEIH